MHACWSFPFLPAKRWTNTRTFGEERWRYVENSTTMSAHQSYLPCCVGLERIADGDEILQWLGHLQALDVQVPAVEPIIDPLLAAVEPCQNRKCFCQNVRCKQCLVRRIIVFLFRRTTCKKEKHLCYTHVLWLLFASSVIGYKYNWNYAGDNQSYNWNDKSNNVADASLCAISLSWCGNFRSEPPPLLSFSFFEKMTWQSDHTNLEVRNNVVRHTNIL